jgi:hypothetical protein
VMFTLRHLNFAFPNKFSRGFESRRLRHIGHDEFCSTAIRV